MKTDLIIRALIVEDEPLARLTIRDFLAGEGWLEIVGEAADGHEAVRLIDELRPDLIFLDIKMPGLNGLQVLKSARHEPQVIFTTAYDDHALTAFELEALDYILKPFGRERFRRTLERIRRRLVGAGEADDPSAHARALHALADKPAEHLLRLFVRDRRGRVVQVRVAEITRLIGADDYVEVYAHNTSYLVNLTLNEFEQRLDPQHFRRVHRSAIINLDHLISCRPVDRRLILNLSDGAEVIASRSGSQSLRHLFGRT